VLASAFVIEYSDGSYAPFSRDTLFASIYESCRHREHAADDASALTKTIVSHLLRSPNKKPGTIHATEVIKTTQQTLQAFDTAAYTYYTAYYGKSKAS
jgi:transcriptional regulator NrdR family protein